MGAAQGELSPELGAVRSRAATAALLLGVAGAYYGAAKLGLELSVANGLITPVWAPTGIALAAALLFGRRVLPAVALAAFLANATSGASLPMALAIAAGNTLEAAAGRELLVRARFRPGLTRVRDVLALIFLGAAVSTALSATNGVTWLWIAGDLHGSYGSSWLLWWVGDGMGDLLVASLLLVVVTTSLRPFARRLPEAAALLALLVGLGCFVFLAGYWRYPHLLFPLYVWATLRFGQVGAVTSSFTVAALAIAGAVSGDTPLANASGTHVVLILEGLIAGITISVVILGAVLAERSEAQELLAEAEAVAHLGSWSWDIGEDRISWSDEMYRLFGVEPGRPLAFDAYLERLDTEDRELASSLVRQALVDRQPFEFEHRTFAPDGSVRWLSGRGRVVTGPDGRPVRMVGTAQDITDRKQVDELRDNILAAVSHELRTPLTAILGFALTLRERAFSGMERERMLDALATQARRLERLLADLLDLERLRHGGARLHLVEADVARLVEQIVVLHADGAHPIAFQANGPATATVDAAKLERIVENLLLNAIRHTEPGTAVEVAVAGGVDGIEIRVDDAGPGVPPEERELIFETFYRGRAAGSRPGAGVGLDLVRRFAELHGGRAWVEDRPGGGASFRVLLPVAG